MFGLCFSKSIYQNICLPWLFISMILKVIFIWFSGFKIPFPLSWFLHQQYSIIWNLRSNEGVFILVSSFSGSVYPSVNLNKTMALLQNRWAHRLSSYRRSTYGFLHTLCYLYMDLHLFYEEVYVELTLWVEESKSGKDARPQHRRSCFHLN